VAGQGTKIGASVAVVVLGILGVIVVLRQGDDGSGAEQSAEEYLAAWEAGDTDEMTRLVFDPPASFAEAHTSMVEALEVEDARYELTDVNVSDNEAVARFTATLSLAGLGDWSYDGALQLQHHGGDPPWRINWSLAAIHPKLTSEGELRLNRKEPERAPILDAAGEPLVTARAGTRIGIEPQRMQDRQQVKDALETYLGVDPATVDARLDAPGVAPDHFVDIVTVPTTEYEPVRGAIYPIPGLLFRESTVRTGPSDGFAQHVIGVTGEITAEQLEELGPPYEAGDIVGRTGLEARFEPELAGTESAEIQLVDPTDAVLEVLGRIEGDEPTPLATTLDPQVQTAVDRGLADIDKPTAAVVVDADGNIRATASRPLNDGFNRALGGAYPPGSTFKIVSTSGLLDSGLTPDSEVECPETVDAGGRQFRNFEGGSLGTVPFGTAFADSCNTAFINATSDLPGADLVTAAERFGFNSEYSVGLTTQAGSFPEPADATEKAAATIGQGRVLASPLHMATVAAAVIDGAWEPPTLLPDLEDEDRPDPVEIGGDTRDTLYGLMRRAVTEGSGTAADISGVEIAGKTGTAEFGSGDPPPTHAWFVAIRGDLALALIIEEGGVGGRDAAPVAARILAELP
jgi:cell division protein FtsI/penicillin-binding protein 2